MLKTFTSKITAEDVRDEALWFLFVPAFAGGVLLYAGIPFLWVLGVVLVIEVIRLWDSGLFSR